MENIGKLLILGFIATLFAMAVMLTLYMYRNVLNTAELIQDKMYMRSIMEAIYE